MTANEPGQDHGSGLSTSWWKSTPDGFPEMRRWVHRPYRRKTRYLRRIGGYDHHLVATGRAVDYQQEEFSYW